ncbi:hypothetical protein O181_061342 [Austropuccinia psidii MF-1]|uniref:Uncharacterized protein n=1 Tax=Austropuccinia psidii MF-1 TaxID=1389203 RepID=A0A9Q3EQ92_9BASI|nr:hypothetical protein [Austropuccinia psidii MF-1]
MSTQALKSQSQMPKEDQIILMPYANLASVLIFLQNSTPLESLHPICLNSLNRILPYPRTQELTIQGRGVLSQPWKIPLSIGVYGNSSLHQYIKIWPYPHFYSILNLVTRNSLLTIHGPRPYPAPLASVQFAIPPAQANTSFTLPGASGPSNPIQGLCTTPFD